MPRAPLRDISAHHLPSEPDLANGATERMLARDAVEILSLLKSTDLLGIAMAGPEGNRLMGLGFPDQTIIWDGSAVENTTNALLEEQSAPIPWRTVDIPSGFDSSLASDGSAVIAPVVVETEVEQVETFGAPVRGLW